MRPDPLPPNPPSRYVPNAAGLSRTPRHPRRSAVWSHPHQTGPSQCYRKSLFRRATFSSGPHTRHANPGGCAMRDGRGGDPRASRCHHCRTARIGCRSPRDRCPTEGSRSSRSPSTYTNSVDPSRSSLGLLPAAARHNRPTGCRSLSGEGTSPSAALRRQRGPA
jgi:hypothetical protein